MSEQLVRFGPSAGLAGTLTLPDSGPRRDVGVVFFNAGFIHRVGPERLNVRLARLAARQGFAALRFDLAGLGDSARRAGSVRDLALEDLAAALELLERTAHVKRFVLIGLCSGTDHCLAAAERDPRVAGVVLLDPLAFPNRKTHFLAMLHRFEQHGTPLQFLVVALRAVAQRLRFQRRRRNRRVDDRFIDRHLQSREEFTARLAALVARGVHLRVIYTGSIPNDYNYAEQFRDSHGDLANSALVDCVFMPGADHTFSGSEDQRELGDRLVGWLNRLHDATPVTPTSRREVHTPALVG